MINELIDKQDNFEIVRDQIAAILKLNIDNQQRLASEKGLDVSQWDFKVYSERSNPWEDFQESEGGEIPIVNVWFDSLESDDAGSDTVERQKVSGLYNIDCYAMGVSTESSEGHEPGDEVASINVHRVARLVRNILMAGENTYLGLRGVVWGRKVNSINVFRPSADDATIQNIIGARLVFRVVFNETSPQVPSVKLELISVQVKRAETGEILIKTEYQYDGT